MPNMPATTRSSGKVRPQRLFVEVVERRALLLGVVGDVPGLRARRVRSLETRRNAASSWFSRWNRALGLVPAGRRGTPARARRSAPCGLPAPGRRNRRSPAARAFSRAQLQDAADERAVVAARPTWRARCRRGRPVSRMRGVVEVRHDREIARRLQGEAPALHALCARRSPARRATAVGGRPASSASSAITSSNALVASSTFSANLVVTLVSSTSISSSRAFRPGPAPRRGGGNRPSSCSGTAGAPR